MQRTLKTQQYERKQTTQVKSGQKAWMFPSPNKTCKWHVSPWKGAKHHVSFRNCSEKHSETPRCAPVGIHSGTATGEESAAISYKAKCALSMWFSSHSPCHLPKDTENLRPYEDLHMDVYSSAQNSEATKVSFSWGWINKLQHIQTMEYYLAIKEPSGHVKTWGNPKCTWLREANKEGHLLYDSNLDILEKAKTWRQ